MSHTTHLFLVRHAQAHVNVTGVIGGPRGDTGLTQRGVAQASALRDRLAREGFRPDVFLASSLPRARQTAQILGDGIGMAAQLDDDLQELRVGEGGDGLSLEEYKRHFGWIDFDDEPFTAVDPGGESWALFQLRVASTLERIARENAGKTVLAVTHGGVIDGSFQHFFRLDPHHLPPARLHTENTSITHWAWDAAHERRRPWRLVRYNDASHLNVV